ncbi:Hypothetical protein SMAX5B_006186 [Scophthalmus maximus]|uniref:Uncharacterized protein n=1 Tax=Scophthalmus maximus TaxID=52904 RepID=A0A2U9BKA9_SCOMX|nr:Hypothetical protein SMAX5B_006186 [Scophthalmus maximus]KAF0047297.1 hypothetical protein F2P81_000930 [Scophthalmus maximus]
MQMKYGTFFCMTVLDIYSPRQTTNPFRNENVFLARKCTINLVYDISSSLPSGTVARQQAVGGERKGAEGRSFVQDRPQEEEGGDAALSSSHAGSD